jgi:glutamate/tyrosine decarboxylase-like PLP-dependent enzyme
MCISGSMFEERYTIDGEGKLQNVHTETIPEHVATWISDEMGLHAVGNNGNTLACSLHCYIPGFTTPCKIYDAISGKSTEVTAIPTTPSATPLYEVVMKQVADYITQFDDPTRAPVLSLQRRSDIEKMFSDSRCPIDFNTCSGPIDDHAITVAIRTACELSVHTGHMYFFNQLLSKADPLATSVDALVSAMNVNMYNFENAPVLMLLERRLLEHLASFLNWNRKTTKGEEGFDGMFLPSASICNLTAMHAARQSRFAEMTGKLMVYTSDESHHSIEKACMILGLGRGCCKYVPCHPSTGSMNTQELELAILETIARGDIPFFINATAGTTHSGAFDDCLSVSKIGKKYGCWVHVDGAVGASFLVPQEEPFISLVSGIQNADSVSWNLHKLLGIPLPCSVLLTQHTEALRISHSTNQSDSNDETQFGANSMSTADKSIMSSRRADAFKAWVLWKKVGDIGMANRVRLIYMHNMDFAQMIRQYPHRVSIDNPTISDEVDEPLELNQGAFALAYEPTSTCTCFYWIPHCLRERFQQEGPQKLILELGAVAQRLKARMLQSGSLMVSHFSTRFRPHFWRIPNIHPSMSQQSMWGVLKFINRIGNECFPCGEYIDWEKIYGQAPTLIPSPRNWKIAPEIDPGMASISQPVELLDMTQECSIWKSA